MPTVLTPVLWSVLQIPNKICSLWRRLFKKKVKIQFNINTIFFNLKRNLCHNKPIIIHYFLFVRINIEYYFILFTFVDWEEWSSLKTGLFRSRSFTKWEIRLPTPENQFATLAHRLICLGISFPTIILQNSLEKVLQFLYVIKYKNKEDTYGDY